MKTIDEFIRETESSETLRNEMKEIKDTNAFREFLKEHDVSVSVEELTVISKYAEEGEIPDDDAEAVAGGNCPWPKALLDTLPGDLRKIFISDASPEDYYTGKITFDEYFDMIQSAPQEYKDL